MSREDASSARTPLPSASLVVIELVPPPLPPRALVVIEFAPDAPQAIKSDEEEGTTLQVVPDDAAGDALARTGRRTSNVAGTLSPRNTLIDTPRGDGDDATSAATPPQCDVEYSGARWEDGARAVVANESPDPDAEPVVIVRSVPNVRVPDSGRVVRLGEAPETASEADTSVSLLS